MGDGGRDILHRAVETDYDVVSRFSNMQSTPTPTVPPSQDIRPPDQGAKITLLVIGLLAVAFAFSGWIFWWPEHVRDELMKTGLPADAVILSADPTGNVYNNQPQVQLTLEVHPKDGAVYKAETRMIINPIYVPQFQPGKLVHIRYDQKDKFKVAIEETENGQR